MEKSKFVFLTPAYNCEEEISNTLFSFFAQSYSNWRAIIIDDVSTDRTGDYATELAIRCGFGGKVSLLRREEKFGEVRNTVDCMDMIDDDEIVCRVDGGDWLTENDCLFMLNNVYANYNPSVLWTGHRWAYTDHNISGELNLSKGQTVYQHKWVSSHMKTFRASKLKRVPKENSTDKDGNWIMIACDQAVFLPMMHMAHQANERLLFFPRVCYHYNINLNDPDLFSSERSLDQKASGEWIRKRGFVS
jgi:glycosyltransferase involved in cell wall biosynthesis